MYFIDNTEINRGLWADFVRLHPLGNVFQSPEMYELYSGTHNYKPLAIACIEDGTIIGLLLAVIISNGPTFTMPFTARSIISGGPLVKDNDQEIIHSLFFEYHNRLPKYVVYSEIRPVYDIYPISSAFIAEGFMRIGHFNLSLDLKAEVSTLWEQMHKERRRNVKKAQNLGLEFRELKDDDSISDIISLISQAYKRKRVPLSHLSLFSSARIALKDYIRYFAAYYNGKMVAGQIRLFYGNLAYAWYAGSDEKCFKLYPNDFLMWNVICWAHEHGFEYFDFGGGGEPGVPYGVRDYKLKFGCKIEDFGRYRSIYHPLVYRIGKAYAKMCFKR